jgi:hypothetical protein
MATVAQEPWVSARTGSAPGLWAASQSVGSSYEALAALTRLGSQRWGAGHITDNEPWFPQQDRPSGHTERHAATERMRLK